VATLIAGTNLGRRAAVGRRRVAAVDVSTPLLVSLEHCRVSFDGGYWSAAMDLPAKPLVSRMDILIERSWWR